MPAQQSVQPTGGILRRFRAFFYASGFFLLPDPPLPLPPAANANRWAITLKTDHNTMISNPKISRELLKELLYGWHSYEQLSKLLREHLELREYHRVAVSAIPAFDMIMNVIGQQIVDGEDIRSIEELSDSQWNNWILKWLLWDEKILSNHPKIPDEVMRSILSKTEAPQEALDVFLNIHVGLEYPDYLTEESFWLVEAVDSGIHAKFHGRCEYALRFCLENRIDKQFILDILCRCSK
ncbi:MAG: hypothetical protein ACOY16_08360 [Chloroflexota bacterium]